ncbi:ABC transporter substrate-binding protein [Haematococcus lacustris]|uniref:ABC transporter substrate-binding protein n=1 Tax=Haematococcus lacustris TaxID=44745 RepID=A0A699ZQV7_HAELA|nr:ABC transporter substrate-binding protein [Haematococcus lacustris]
MQWQGGQAGAPVMPTDSQTFCSRLLMSGKQHLGPHKKHSPPQDDWGILHHTCPGSFPAGLHTAGASDTQGSAQGYDVVMFSSFMMGDIAASDALVDLMPYISNDTDQVVAWNDYPPFYTASSRFKDQVVGIPFVQSPLLMYVNWPLLTSVYNISKPSLIEFGRLSFYPDTWQELAAVMRQVNATASDPVTGMPRHALCMLSENDSGVLFTAVLTSMMQTDGTSQGWLYDPLTLEPLTNNTAMLKALDIMWELSPFLRGFDSSYTIDMSQSTHSSWGGCP